MKISIDIECTPDEARRFFGLPDVIPVQEAMMGEIQRRMLAGLENMDAEALMKTWLPVGLQGMEQLQKMFWSQMTPAPSGDTSGATSGDTSGATSGATRGGGKPGKKT
jgi:Family of unknown function (DUF6489)